MNSSKVMHELINLGELATNSLAGVGIILHYLASYG